MKHKINDKQRKSIITFCIVLTVLTILNILAFTTSTSLTKHTEDNTYEVSGTVVDFEYVEPGYFGQKIRHPHIIHLDNGIDCVFHYLNYEMHYDDPNQEKISNELEGQYVVIRLSKIDDSVITINTNEKCYLSFEASNRQHIIGIIGVVLFDFSVLFISFICFINPILPIKKRVDKKHIAKLLFLKSKKEKINEKYSELFHSFFTKNNAKMILFEIYPKTFGNIVLKFEYKGIEHTCISDRGEIWLDGDFVSDSLYHVSPKDDTKDQMMKVIEEKLFK